MDVQNCFWYNSDICHQSQISLPNLVSLISPAAGSHQEEMSKAAAFALKSRGHVGAELSQHHERPNLSGLKEMFGGYDCEFVEPPPSVFQTECPICHLILREPFLVSCCGTHYCHTCIQQLQADNSPCPICREDNFDVFPNKGLNRSLKQLQVYCIHRKDGCQWRGELGGLDQHLNDSEDGPHKMVAKEGGEGMARRPYKVRSLVSNSIYARKYRSGSVVPTKT